MVDNAMKIYDLVSAGGVLVWQYPNLTPALFRLTVHATIGENGTKITCEGVVLYEVVKGRIEAVK